MAQVKSKAVLLDEAVRLIQASRKGQASLGAVCEVLKLLDDSDLNIVSELSRFKLGTLKALKGAGTLV